MHHCQIPFIGQREFNPLRENGYGLQPPPAWQALAHERVHQCRPNLAGMASSDPDHFTFPFSLTLQDRVFFPFFIF